MKKLLLPLAVLLLSACSVKEDRSLCPAFLQLRLSEKSLKLAGRLPVRLLVSDGEGSDTLELDASEPALWHKTIRGPVSVEGILSNGASADVAWGGQSDSLWASSEVFLLECEEESREVTLHKRFTTINFILDEAIDPAPYRLTLDGEVSGTELAGLSPISGEFRYLLEFSGNSASVRLPAQGDESPLELFCSSLASGEVLWGMNLKRELEKAGFDWRAEDLADARVYINLVPLKFIVEIGEWRDGGEMNEVF